MFLDPHQRQERNRGGGGISAAGRRHRRAHRSTSMTDAIAPIMVDAFGLTDRGLLRDGNEDHFMVAHVTKAIDVQQTSLPSAAVANGFTGVGDGYLLAVADGVG